MARRLPDDPLKRRYQVFKRLYQHLEHWQALMEDRGMQSVITDEATGEDIYIGDLLIGLDSLPPQQRRAFELICLQGYTETAARDELLPNSKSSTPVQQYADSGLVRMVDAYDAAQQGSCPLAPVVPAPATTFLRRKIMAVLHPLVKKHLEDARKEFQVQIAELQKGLAQVEDMLGVAKSTSTQPAPTPRPEGRPDLKQAAKELAATG